VPKPKLRGGPSGIDRLLRRLPRLEFIGNGRGANKIAGKSVVWELKVKGDEVTRLAIDFIQHSEETKPPLYRMIQVNSSFY
jgi:hypothetical protein